MQDARRGPWFALILLAACTGGSKAPVEVVITSLSPSPGAFGVSRRVVVRTAFDRDLDPASCTAENCYLEVPGNGRVAADIAYEPATRILTLTPNPALEPLTGYRVQLTKNLRTLGGSPFASASQWDFTTDNAPVWERARNVAEGTLLACRASRSGGVLAVWTAPNGILQFGRSDGSVWSVDDLGLGQIAEAEVADDAAGNIVVLARTDFGGALFSLRRAPGELFQAPVQVGGTVDEILDFDMDGGRMLLATRLSGVASVRPWVFGVGWLPPTSLANTRPLVHVDPTGLGTAVCGFNRFVPFLESTTWCERRCIDLAGVVQSCDPPLAVPNSFVRASKAAFGEEGRIVAAQTVDTTSSNDYATLTRLFEYRPLTGWSPLPVLLGEDPAAYAIAVGPGLSTAMTMIAEGLRPSVWVRGEAGFAQRFLGSSDEPAPINPVATITIDARAATGVLWTSKSAAAANAPARLLGACQPPGDAFGEPVLVDGPFADATIPLQQLQAFAIGQNRAFAMWSRDGVIRSTLMH